MMKPFKILSKETLVDSPYMHVEKQKVVLPNGKESYWLVNVTDDAVIILPILKNGEILLQRNYKHGCGKVVIEFCAGMIDKGEVPIEAAEREFREETGYKSGKMQKVGEVFANPTGSTMKYHFFIATDCEVYGSQELGDAEQIEVFTVSGLEEAEKLLLGDTENIGSVAVTGLAYLQNFLKK